jgi:hypothetical protein
MNGNDILARQREALKAFRQAEALRAEQEKEARELRPKAEKEAKALRTQLNKLLAEAHQQFEQGLASLERVALARLLYEKRLWTEPKVVKAEPGAELARSVEDASRAVSDLDRSVEALIQHRRRRKKILEAVGIGGSLLGCIGIGILSCVLPALLLPFRQLEEVILVFVTVGVVIGLILWFCWYLVKSERG